MVAESLDPPAGELNSPSPCSPPISKSFCPPPVGAPPAPPPSHQPRLHPAPPALLPPAPGRLHRRCGGAAGADGILEGAVLLCAAPVELLAAPPRREGGWPAWGRRRRLCVRQINPLRRRVADEITARSVVRARILAFAQEEPVAGVDDAGVLVAGAGAHLSIVGAQLR